MTRPAAGTADLERCFRLYRIEGKTGREVAQILDTQQPNVTRWAQRFEQKFPERARAMITEAQQAAGMRRTKSGANVHTPRSAFLERVRDEVDRVQDEPAIPGFEADDADEPPDDDAQPVDVDATAMARRLLANVERRARNAERDGDHVTATRCGSQAADLMIVIARLERLSKEGDDVLHISRADIEKTWKEVMAKARVVCSRPLVCEHCGKAMMVAFAADPGTAEP